MNQQEFAEHIKHNYHEASLSRRQLALCEFAEKLTLTSWKITEDDLHKLRSEGLSDRDILDAVQVISYFNYINRIADALGIDPEPWMSKR